MEIDGVKLRNGDRILLQNQPGRWARFKYLIRHRRRWTSSENGIYVVRGIAEWEAEGSGPQN